MTELKEHVAKKIGAIAKPDDVIFTADLPKTRSGKIMRRLLRDIAEGKALGDTTTLADPNVVARLKEQYQENTDRSLTCRAREPDVALRAADLDDLDAVASCLLRPRQCRFGPSKHLGAHPDRRSPGGQIAAPA